MAALAFGLFSVAPAAAQGSGFDVRTNADTVDASIGDGVCADGAGMCSLRAAVQEANATGGGEIELRGGVSYRLSLAGDEDAAVLGDLDISSRVTIDGNGATVDARGVDRVFHVLAGASLTLDEVRITGGVADGTGVPANSGGGVRRHLRGEQDHRRRLRRPRRRRRGHRRIGTP